jgi:energy-coupling factor transporter ATP-binding protein EcfA2
MALKRNLPVLTQVRLHHFSLYANNRNLSIPIRPGVFCLAGANGMGKSTFLAAINYALTGIVPDPTKAYNRADKFYSDGVRFAKVYFDGRVQQEDWSEAAVSLNFRIGNHNYSLTRKISTQDQLSHLDITDLTGNAVLDTSQLDAPECDAAYKRRIVEDCRIGTFQYFAFMQSFLLTFDERRHLLFWDSRAANLALYIAFGVEPEDVENAERIRLSIDAAESNARNAQWQATITRNSMKKMAGADTPGILQLRERHDGLVEQLDDARDEFALADRTANDAALAAAGAGAHHQALRQEYDRVFSIRLAGDREPARHPLIVKSLADHICDICGSNSDESIRNIEIALSNHRCPLCSHSIELSDHLDLEELERIDDQLAAAKAQADNAQAKADRLRADAAAAGRRAAAIAADLDNFESANVEGMKTILSASSDVERQRRSLEGEYDNAVARRDENRRQRDELRIQLEPLQRKLTSAYQEGELDFVPAFRSLAKSFIGLDLDVSLQQAGDVYDLSLEMLGARRESSTELSESQRFFIEIALKMAMTQYMCSEGSAADLLIDTPEGSLDIAYEARAGDMFANFAEAGYNLIITANINSSQLLLRLARRCTSEHMELVRMTEWAPLTEVQADEEDLFNFAYANIEEQLDPSAEDGDA